jgi:diguanylate cyclase (GGDEF)-like protein
LERLIGEVRRGGPSAAVFFIDLDHFKDVNDTLGHHIGDELILAVTQRLSHVMRGDDLVARLGGDEFAILTICASDSYSLHAIAGRIISAVCAPYLISGHAINIGASIGIAVIDRRARDAGDILRYADMALYRAKNEGRNRACIYDAAMDADLWQRKLLESDLLHAIRNDGLAAAYQPIVNASGDTMVGVEALARWTHPTAGVIPPSVFIPIAENSGLIVELGEWMLRRACLDGRNWPGLMVAVNVSPLQFRRSDFVDVVERILKETDFDASRLELELTESTLQPGNGGIVDAAAQGDRRAFCARRLRHRLFEPALFAAVPVRQAQDRFELRAQHRDGARRGRDRARRCQSRPRSGHAGDCRRRGECGTASVPARRRRPFHARLSLRPAGSARRHQRAHRLPRRLSRRQSRPGNRTGELRLHPSTGAGRAPSPRLRREGRMRGPLRRAQASATPPHACSLSLTRPLPARGER